MDPSGGAEDSVSITVTETWRVEIASHLKSQVLLWVLVPSLGVYFNFSEPPQFPYLENGYNNICLIYFKMLMPILEEIIM